MILLKLFRNEILKLHRSLAASMVLLAPLSVVLLMLLMFGARAKKPEWVGLAQGAIAVWAYMVFPLLVALQAAVVNGIEHRVDGWKRMFALPISPARFFLAKLFALMVLMLVASLILVVSVWSATFLMHGIAPSWPAPPDGGFAMLASGIAGCFVAGLTIIVIHHAVSWSMPSFVFPIGLGIVAVMAVFQVGSSVYWVWHPWAWCLMASAGGDPANREIAVQLGLLIGVPLAFLLAPLARRSRL